VYIILLFNILCVVKMTFFLFNLKPYPFYFIFIILYYNVLCVVYIISSSISSISSSNSEKNRIKNNIRIIS